jgi:hypothetical protein
MITHECTDIYSRLGKGAAYDAQKKKLPMAMFCCTFDENNGAKGKHGRLPSTTPRR